MIQRILATIQDARRRPPSPITAFVGVAFAGVGLGLLQRFYRHQVQQVAATADELDILDRQLERLRRERDAQVEPDSAPEQAAQGD